MDKEQLIKDYELLLSSNTRILPYTGEESERKLRKRCRFIEKNNDKELKGRYNIYCRTAPQPISYVDWLGCLDDRIIISHCISLMEANNP